VLGRYKAATKASIEMRVLAEYFDALTRGGENEMSASIPGLVTSTPCEEIVAALQERGAAIVEGVLAPDLLARWP
jgi:hypothetical protein